MPESASGSGAIPPVVDEPKREPAPPVAAPWYRGWLDLAIVAVLVAVAATGVLLEAPAGLRVPLGIALVLGLPGYALTAALFPSNDGPDGVARAALSVALSLATVPPLALAIDRSPWRIGRTTVTLGLLLVTLVAVAVAGVLRARLPVAERYVATRPVVPVPPPRTWTRPQRAVVGMLALAALLFAVGGYGVVKTRLIGAPLTEFALYNASGAAQFYPRTITVGQPAEVRISITNHEHKRLTYRLVVAGAGVAVDPLPQPSLADGETWQGTVRFTVTASGSDLPIRFELYRLDLPTTETPYRLLRLVVAGQAA